MKNPKFYLELVVEYPGYHQGEWGQYSVWYSTGRKTKKGKMAWSRLFVITKAQAEEMRADGWPYTERTTLTPGAIS